MGAWDAFLDALFSVRSVQQFLVLYKKNALVAWRNRRATALRIFAPFLFLLLALIIDRALQANDARTNNRFKDVTDPTPANVGPIPRCSQDMYIGEGRDCKEVLYSPSPNPVVDAIMAGVRTRNANPITVEGYPDRSSIQAYLFANPDTVLAAVHFEVAPGGELEGFVLQTNTTAKYFKGEFQHPNKFVQLPLQAAVHREIARYQLGASGQSALADALSWAVSLVEFPHPTVATNSVLGQVLGPFVFAAVMFSFVTQIAAVVSEKELGLKQALRTMGMKDGAYWASWAMWEVTLAFVVANSIVIYGLILQFDLFLENNYGLLFFLFFLFQLAMSSLALLVSAFVRRTQVAVYLGFLIFIAGWIMQVVVVFGVPYTPDFYKEAGGAIYIIFSLFPWDLLAKGFQDLGAAALGPSPGLRWSERKSYCQNIPVVDNQPPYNPREQYISYECVMPLDTMYGIFVALWLGYFVLAVYFDNILPNEYGVRRPIYYFLMPSYWFPARVHGRDHLKQVERDLQHIRQGAGGRPGSAGLRRGRPVPPQEGELDPDVKAEEEYVQSLLQHRTGERGSMALQGVASLTTTPSGRTGGLNAVEVYGLTKMYKGGRGCCGTSIKCCSAFDCCSCEKTDDFWAIKGSWFAIEENQLFCLLGPNGAGKTTTINCLTGAIPPTSGEALVYEEAISSTGGLDRIRAQMGVCPQFDILWGELSGAEHLSIYGHIKGLPRNKVRSEVDTLLDKVKLTYAAGQRSGSYSGGMKRRLSVAIALLGDPKIVYLDEPTTGMDPISRRYVWDIIQEAKVGRAIVLTTHSMEEADILADRIAIMARGKLRCIGTALRLKQRFGSGYTLAVSVTAGGGGGVGAAEAAEAAERRAEAVKRFVQERLGLAPVEESKAYISWLVERSREEALVAFLRDLEAQRDALGVTDVQLSLTSLEEVFLNIARKAEMEAAASSGSGEVVHVLDDGGRLRIPLGAELVQHPTTGVAYKVRWGTDEAGRLCINDCTPLDPAAMPTMPYPGMPPCPLSPLPVAVPTPGASSSPSPHSYPVGMAMGMPPGGGYPLAAPVPSPALAAGLYPGQPPAPMSGNGLDGNGQGSNGHIPNYPGYNGSYPGYDKR